MDNFSQKTPSFNKGQALPAGALNHVVEAVKRMIVAGTGMRIERAGDQIVLHAKGQPMARGGGGGGDAVAQIWTTASTKAGLDNDSVSELLLGRVTAGSQKGMVCVRNPDNDGWVSINFWDTP